MEDCVPLPYPWWGDFKKDVILTYIFILIACFIWEVNTKGPEMKDTYWSNRLGVGFLAVLLFVTIFELGWVNQERHPGGKYVDNYCKSWES